MFTKKKYVRVEGLAAYTGLKPKTIRAYVLKKQIPFIKFNGCILFDLQEIDRWLAAKKVPALDRMEQEREGGEHETTDSS